jgi:hypothetical protein
MKSPRFNALENAVRQVLFDDETEAARRSAPMADRFGAWLSAVWPPATALAGIRSSCWRSPCRLGWTPITIPAPSAVAAEFGQSGADLVYHIVPSIMATISGSPFRRPLAATLAGIGASWRRASGPVMTFGVLVDSTPLIAVAPILIVFVGGGHDAACHRLGHRLFLSASDRHDARVPRRRRHGGRAVPRARRLPLATAGETRAAERAALHLRGLQDRRAARGARHADRRVDGGRARRRHHDDLRHVLLRRAAGLDDHRRGLPHGDRRLRGLRAARTRLPALGRGWRRPRRDLPVDTPDWRALPTRGQKAEARLAAFWRFVFLRVGIGVALLVALWGAADRGFRRARFVAPGRRTRGRPCSRTPTGCSGRSASR